MPKEIAHFVLARKTAGLLPEGSIFQGAVAAYPTLFTLGAVAPEICFYRLAGPDAAAVQALSLPFHRTDSSALAPVLAFLEARRNHRAALALAAGVVCHILSDTRFHPLVYYYAGMDGVHSGATARHRQFETAMDLWFWAQDRCEPRLSRLVKCLEIPKPRLVRLLTALFRPETRLKNEVSQALRWHMGLQYLFIAPWMKQILTLFRRLGRPFPALASGMVYPFAHPVALPFFSGPVSFQDPCTGEGHETRMAEMTDKAVDATLKALSMISRALREGQPLSRVLEDPQLPVIRPGLPVTFFTFWQERQDILPCLYQGVTPPF